MLSAPGGTATSAFLGTSDRTRSSSAAHLEAPWRLPFSARATAQAVQAQRTWRHRDVCLSRHKRPHTQFKCSAPGGTMASAFLATSSSTQEVQAHRTWRPHDVCLSRPRVKLSAPGGTMTSVFVGTSDRTSSSCSVHLEAPRRLPFSAQATAHAVQAQRTWRHRDVCLSRHKRPHTQFKCSAPVGTTTSAFLATSSSTQEVQAHRTWRHRDVCLSRPRVKLSAPGGTMTSVFLGTSDRTSSSCSVHLEAPRRLPFSAQATAHAVQAQRTWRHRDVCLSRHKRPHTQFKCSAPVGTTTSAFLATSSSTQEVQAHRTWRHRDVCLSRHKRPHTQFKCSAPGGTTTSAFLATSSSTQEVQAHRTWRHHDVCLSRHKFKHTRSSSTPHLEAPGRLPFSPQVQAHKQFKHTAPGGPTTSAFLGPGLNSAHLEAP
ncbi:hypothetical protein PF003_g18004 [Phytophthora fragariae]|nr:hypothetical protein PF003_g18004 [Phytophthora fragariae]